MNEVRSKLRWVLFPALFAALCAPAGPVRAQDSDELHVHITQVDASGFPTVKVYISVTDAAGEPAPVAVERIQLLENGNLVKPQSVTALGESAPLTTMLVMDISGSMAYEGKMESAKAAAIAYVNQMRAGDEAGLVSFHTEIAYVQPTTADRETLKAAIESLTTASDTAMYDAVYTAIDLLESTGGRKAIIVLTDGMDNRSKHTAQEVIDRIGPEGLSISTIGLGDPAKKTEAYAGIDEPALQDLAQQAGGTYGYADNPSSLRKLYEQYGRALQSEYVITYVSPAALRDGLNRTLDARLSESIPNVPGQSSFNPGGLVPEVAAASSSTWTLFLGLLILLGVMLFAPVGVQTVMAYAQGQGKTGQPAAKPAPPKIKLSEPKKKSRVKLK